MFSYRDHNKGAMLLFLKDYPVIDLIAGASRPTQKSRAQRLFCVSVICGLPLFFSSQGHGAPRETRSLGRRRVSLPAPPLL